MDALQTQFFGSMQYQSGMGEPAALTLDQSGMIQDCTDAGEELFGFSRSELAQHHISLLFPQLSDTALLSNGLINSRLLFLSHCGHLFWAMDRDGEAFFSELFFSQLEYGAHPILRVIVRPSDGAPRPNA